MGARMSIYRFLPGSDLNLSNCLFSLAILYLLFSGKLFHRHGKSFLSFSIYPQFFSVLAACVVATWWRHIILTLINLAPVITVNINEKMCFKTCLLTPIKKKKIFNYFILIKIKDAVLVRKRLTWQRRAEGKNRLRHVCLICFLGQMRLTRSEHSLLFSRDKVAAQRRGERLKLPLFGPFGYSFSALWWDRDHLCEVYKVFFHRFSILLASKFDD